MDQDQGFLDDCKDKVYNLWRMFLDMKNTILLAIIGLFVLGGIFLFTKDGSAITENVVNQGVSGDVQAVTLSEKDLNYYPNTFTVESGKPVELTLDSSVKGCLRSFNIKDLGVSKYAKTPNDKIIFTPTKKGSHTFACSMGMGYGTIIVK